jgi:hypothetical protein
MIIFRDTDQSDRSTSWVVEKTGPASGLCFRFRLAGEWTGKQATEMIFFKLILSGCGWLTHIGEKAMLNSLVFIEWLFASSFADRVTEFSWLDGTHEVSVILHYSGEPSSPDSRTTDLTLEFTPATQWKISPPWSSRGATMSFKTPTSPFPPSAIQEGLSRMKNDYPNGIAFVMMKFGGTKAHHYMVEAIKETLEPCNITALRADEKEYHTDLFYNILTYIHGCKFGIAVFDRVESDEHNPNVALEVGYLLGLDKKVCLLKDQTLDFLQTDLIGRLYKKFDPYEVKKTIPPVLTKWLEDYEFKAITKALPKPALTKFAKLPTTTPSIMRDIIGEKTEEGS